MNATQTDAPVSAPVAAERGFEGDAAGVAQALRIEEAGLNNLHTRRQLLYDGWLLFLLAGKAKRARSVNPHFGSSLPVVHKIAHCETLYARHGLSTLFRITPFAQPATLDDALDARGYVAFDRTLVQVADATSAPGVAMAVGDVALSAPLIEGFCDAVGEMRGSSPSQRVAHLERLAQSPLDIRAIVARCEGRVVGAGLVALDGDLAGMFDVVIDASYRRRGIGRAVVAALMSRAWEQGAASVYLQVSADNEPATSLYRAFGFRTLYTYHYRARPHEVE